MSDFFLSILNFVFSYRLLSLVYQTGP